MRLQAFRVPLSVRHWHVAAGLCISMLSACGGGGADSAPPSISAAPASQSIRIGDAVSFSVSAQGDGPLNYQWQRNGADIANATASSYSTTITRIADNGSQWAVRVSNAQGSVTSPAATLTVTPVQSGTISLAPSAYPLERTVDAQGNYLRVENGNVLLVAPDGTTVSTLLARASWVAAGLANGPEHATLDANGVLYFSETTTFNSGCSRVCPTTTVVWKQGADGSLAKFAGDHSPPTEFREGTGTEARFGYLSRMRFHPDGDLYAFSVSEIVRISPSGVARRVAKGQTYDWDAGGAVYVGDSPFDSAYSLVRKITPAGNASVLAGSATENGYRDGPGAQALFNRLSALVVDAGGNVYVSTVFEAPSESAPFSNNIRRIAPSGEVITVAGQRGLRTDGPLPAPLPGALCTTSGDLSIDANGVLYTRCNGSGVLGIRFND
ncbi:hypothetical protein [Pseudorhodoferax sp.]|uniref:hypothetical protein n=1 Tax=Pseudorhodoferax sp. TaxID=1993553 RepID=UPI002DD64561|nr:hypothetical protein [Pseudorhodoferax sp.]